MQIKKNSFFSILSIIFIFFTNSYFTYEESLIFGGSDGHYYISISHAAPFFAENIEYIKGERFILPYIIGIISKISHLESYFIFRFISSITFLVYVYLFYKILKIIKLNDEQIFISLGLVIFNPYLARYFIAVPTSLLDSVFIISLEIILLAFLLNKKYLFYLGVLLSTIARQNGLFVFLVLVFGKICFKKKSKISNKDIIIISVIYLSVFFINTVYALNAQGNESNFNTIKGIYGLTLFGILNFNYSFSDFLKYLIFPLLSFGPMIVYFFYIKNLFFFDKIKLKSELSLFIILLSFLLILIAFVGGPEVTGKNLNRLSNFSYIIILFLINYLFSDKFYKLDLNFYKKIFIVLFFLFWSFHPTFSIFSFFEIFKLIFV